MGGFDHLVLPLAVIGTCAQVLPLLIEVYTWYRAAGQINDVTLDDTCMNNLQSAADWWVSYKRFCDRPPGEASKAWFSFCDWRAPTWDKSAYVARRNMSKGSGEYSKWRVFTYGPFRLNWWRAHSVAWARGQDAAGMKVPVWGDGGEERARREYEVAKDNCLDRYWHYQRLKQVKQQQLAKAQAMEKNGGVAGPEFDNYKKDMWTVKSHLGTYHTPPQV